MKHSLTLTSLGLAMAMVLMPYTECRGNSQPVLPPLLVTGLHGEYVDGSGVMLYWQALTREDARSFDILRSTDGSDFQLVGHVDQQQDVPIDQVYRFRDAGVLPGTYYYRLRKLTVGGVPELSEAIALDVRSEMTTNTYVYPDKISGAITIGLSQDWQGQTVGVEVISKSGQPVTYFTSDVNHCVNVRIKDLGPGTYTVRISSTDRTLTRHVIVR